MYTSCAYCPSDGTNETQGRHTLDKPFKHFHHFEKPAALKTMFTHTTGQIVEVVVRTVTIHSLFFYQAGVVLSRLKGCPLSISVLRWRAQDGTVYRPIIKLLRALTTENPTLQLGPAPSQQSANKDQRNSPSQCLKEGRQVGYQILNDDFRHILLSVPLTLKH